MKLARMVALALVTLPAAGSAQAKSTTTTARELYDEKLALYPNRVNPDVLWSSARSVTP